MKIELEPKKKKKRKKDVDLIEEIMTSRYRFFEETQPPKSLKDYKYFYD